MKTTCVTVICKKTINFTFKFPRKPVADFTGHCAKSCLIQNEKPVESMWSIPWTWTFANFNSIVLIEKCPTYTSEFTSQDTNSALELILFEDTTENSILIKICEVSFSETVWFFFWKNWKLLQSSEFNAKVLGLDFCDKSSWHKLIFGTNISCHHFNWVACIVLLVVLSQDAGLIGCVSYQFEVGLNAYCIFFQHSDLAVFLDRLVTLIAIL